MAESLLTASQRDKFKIVFYEAGLTPDQEISDEKIAQLLHVHHKHIGFTDAKFFIPVKMIVGKMDAMKMQ